MKIGILGTRGIPNAYGGFEQFAQYLAQGLVAKGHEVYVYNSGNHPYQEKTWNNIQLIHCNDPENRIGTAGQFVYDLNCILDARKRKYNILLHLGYTSNSVWYPLWPGGNTINIVNMDGLEWKRSKYGKQTRVFLKFAEKLAAKKADILIADSVGIKEHLTATYGKQSIYIPYGAEIPESYDVSQLAKWLLEAGRYNLLIARMEPENNVEMIIKGFLLSQQRLPLILVGGTNNKFGSYLKDKYSGGNLKFIGGVYESAAINALRHFSASYFHGHSVGGTNPSLLEAMGCACNMAANDNIFNRAILMDNASYFSTEEDVQYILDSPPPDSTIVSRKEKNVEKIRMLYNWEKIINDYEKVFLDACG